jgi:cardiolipin synthase
MPNMQPKPPRVFSNPAHLTALLLIFLGGCVSKPPIDYVLESGYSVSDPQFARTMGNLLGPPLIGGNSIKSLRNGDEIFPEMLGAIKGAKETITFETYIYWSGDIGRQFTEALCERAKAGVHVSAILDWVGSNKISRQYIQRMKDAGVEIVEYHPLRFYDIGSAQRLNNRTHRKLLVIDGKIGFTGGVGIADEWEGNAESPKHWRDMHYRVEGPVVAQLQSAFIDNWLKTTGHVLNDKDHFPALAPAGEQFSQVFKSGAEGGSASMELMFLLSLTAAHKDISIGNAYFVPDDLTIKTLIAARNRGVRVRVIVPGPHLDEQVVRRASHGRWGELLKNGVEIYEFQPTMYHTKLLIVDQLWVSIGSSNLDNRSFRLNDEANLNVLDAKFAAEQMRIFDEDITQSKQMTFEQWKHRPVMERMLEGISQLFAPLL